MKDELKTRLEAEKYLGVSRSTFERLIRKHEIRPARTIGLYRLFRKRDLEKIRSNYKHRSAKKRNNY